MAFNIKRRRRLTGGLLLILLGLFFQNCTDKHSPTATPPIVLERSSCEHCHLNPALLKQTATPAETHSDQIQEYLTELIPVLEPWEKVRVKDDFLNTPHGRIECVACHHGEPTVQDKAGAHVNLVSVPSDSPQVYCRPCHQKQVVNHENSLHSQLTGFLNGIETRLGNPITTDANLMANFQTDCGKCHATCGQCHLQRPLAIQGGFIDGHEFIRRPLQQENCIACHQSRIGIEYLGEVGGYSPDVHWQKHGFSCGICHSPEEMHGSEQPYEHRLVDPNLPRCVDCHSDLQEANHFHLVHVASPWRSKLACQVCHAQDYVNCNGCHTGASENPERIYRDFKIARNYLKSSTRAYDYVCVRHVPVTPATFASWGIATLPNFAVAPTWKYATPHNIQRWTTRTDTTGTRNCFDKCHKTDYYLTLRDLADYEREANQALIIETN